LKERGTKIEREYAFPEGSILGEKGSRKSKELLKSGYHRFHRFRIKPCSMLLKLPDDSPDGVLGKQTGDKENQGKAKENNKDVLKKSRNKIDLQSLRTHALFFLLQNCALLSWGFQESKAICYF
jgi:hypothetical protein